MDDDLAYTNLLLRESSLSANCVRSNLKYVHEKRVFQNTSDNTELAKVISTINTGLHASGYDRVKALLLLETLLTQCPADFFIEYSDGWMQQCSRWNPHTIDHELRILRKLIEKSVTIPGAKNHLTTNILRHYVERLTSVEKTQKCAQTVINSLQCMRSFIHCYSSSCGSHRGNFQKYVTYCLTEYPRKERIIHEAAACFVALCECGTRGQQGINFKEAWSSKFNLLINSCHKLLDTMYSNVNVVGLVTVEPVEEYLPELTYVTNNSETTPMERYDQLLERFLVLTQLLRAMLLCEYSVRKSFRPDVVLNLIRRVFLVTGSVLRKCVQTNDILALTAIVPELHERSFNIVEDLIRCAKRNLIPYSSLISQLCLQSLKWTNSSEWAYGFQKPYQSLRCKGYSVLFSWMSVAGSNSSIEIFADELVPIIIADIEYEKPQVKLTVTTKPSKKGKSRKRGQVLPEMNMISDTSILIDRKANADVCVAAHQALQSLLQSASVFIKWEHHKYLQSVILSLLTKVFESQSSNSYPLPYSDSECRQQLFTSLLSLVQHPHPKWPAPLSLAIQFLPMGLGDENVKVASFCGMALYQIEPIIHPRCPTLYFPTEIPEKSNMASNVCFAVDAPASEKPISIVEESSRTEEIESLPSAKPSESDVRGVKRVQWHESVSASTECTTSSKELPSQCNRIVSVESTSATKEETPSSTNASASISDEVRQEEMVSERKKLMNDQLRKKEEAEPRTKRSKLLPLNEDDDERLAAMLSDFVDTWK